MKWLVSWWHGRRIGDIAWEKGFPFQIGNLMHFLPKEMWTPKEHDLLKYRIIEKVWDGYGWKFKRELELNATELRQEYERLYSTGSCLVLMSLKPLFAGVGRYRELLGYLEYQQWFIVSRPLHPYLKEVMACVVRNIENYTGGVGKRGVLRLTGPIIYTQAIQNVRHQYVHRLASNEEMGFQYSILPGQDHKEYCKKHYSTLTSRIVEK